jgi:hypothetical protein
VHCQLYPSLHMEHVVRALANSQNAELVVEQIGLLYLGSWVSEFYVIQVDTS